MRCFSRGVRKLSIQREPCLLDPHHLDGVGVRIELSFSMTLATRDRSRRELARKAGPGLAQVFGKFLIGFSQFSESFRSPLSHREPMTTPERHQTPRFVEQLLYGGGAAISGINSSTTRRSHSLALSCGALVSSSSFLINSVQGTGSLRGLSPTADVRVSTAVPPEIHTNITRSTRRAGAVSPVTSMLLMAVFHADLRQSRSKNVDAGGHGQSNRTGLASLHSVAAQSIFRFEGVRSGVTNAQHYV
jgi:hypothetical protein